MNLPNYLTLFRLFISPIFLLIYVLGPDIGLTASSIPFCLLFLLFISELTDAFDGYLARKYNQVTDFGKLMDPLADSVARLTEFLCFTQPPVNVPLWLIFMFFYRDSVISTLRTICALRGYALAARTSGKVKAVLQATAVFVVILLMIPHSKGLISDGELTYISTWIVGIVAFYSISSVVDYIYANRHYLGRSLVIRRKVVNN